MRGEILCSHMKCVFRYSVKLNESFTFPIYTKMTAIYSHKMGIYRTYYYENNDFSNAFSQNLIKNHFNHRPHQMLEENKK